MMYQPKGGMCAVCKYKSKDCSELKFSEMPVYNKTEEQIIVICLSFNKEVT